MFHVEQTHIKKSPAHIWTLFQKHLGLRTYP